MSSSVGPGLGASCAAWARGLREAILPEDGGGRCSVHGRDRFVFNQPFHH